LFKEFPNFFYGQKLFRQASQIYNQSKIVFNVAMKDDLNMRVFEVLGSGSFLLTDSVSDLDCLFADQVHLVTYKGLDDMIEKAHYYLKQDVDREKIAKLGHEEVMNKHTIYHRVKEIVEKSHSLIKREVTV